MTQEELAERIGRSLSTVRNWEKGRTTPSRGDLILIARATGARLEWLLTGEGPSGLESEPGPKASAASVDTTDDDVVLVPLVTARAEAGRGELILDTGVESFIAYGKASLRSEIGFLPHRLIALRVTGDSMTPTLVPGDIAIVALDDVELIQGGVYVLRFHDVLMIKRLREANGQKLVLTSDNGAYPPLVFRRDEASQLDIQIVGRVVKVEKFI